MRKVLVLLVVLVFLVAGCGAGDNGNVPDQNGGAAGTKDNGGEAVEVEKNLFSVEITIPASMFSEDDDLEEIKTEAEQEDGVSSVTINTDGSLTYKMTKTAHKKMMAEMKEDLEEQIGEMVNGGDYPSIKDIRANSTHTVFTMVVDKEGFENSFDGVAAFSLGLGSMFFQVFDGADVDSIKATIHVEDVNTGEIIDTVVYPDDLG